MYAFHAFVCIIIGVAGQAQPPAEYGGVDISFPIHHMEFKDEESIHAKRYRRSMQGCYDAFSFSECEATERARVQMNLNQPRTQHNYTEVGFKKVKVPEGIWKDILKFWEQNKMQEKVEVWPRGSTYTNNWESPSFMINFEDLNLRGGWNLKRRILSAVRPILSEWTGGKELMDKSLYGIRIYKDNAVLATHVDYLPLVSSCTINVAQDVDEPWPLELYSHDGKAYSVSMEPGEMLLYESHTVLHGRPFPLKGRYYLSTIAHTLT